MIKNVIFDIGNVLMNFRWKPFIHSLFEDEETIKRVEAAIWHTGLWNELDRNIVPEEEIFHRMRNHDASCKNEVILALQRVGACYSKTEYAIPWIKALKAAGYNVYFLSNYSSFSMRNCPECLDFIPYMDGGVFSCDCKHVKPDPYIYGELCKRYHLEASECVFLDDKAENVEAAISFGMSGIVFDGYTTAKEKLDNMLRRQTT